MENLSWTLLFKFNRGVHIWNDFIILGIAAQLIVVFSCRLTLEGSARCCGSTPECSIVRWRVLLGVYSLITCIQVVKILWLFCLQLESSPLATLAHRKVICHVWSGANQTIDASTASSHGRRGSSWLLRDLLGLQLKVLSVCILLLVLLAARGWAFHRAFLTWFVILAHGWAFDTLLIVLIVISLTLWWWMACAFSLLHWRLQIAGVQ